jgi:carboxylesterase type B
MEALPAAIRVGVVTVKGTTDGWVGSFRGIPYATIPARWREAKPFDLFDTGNVGVIDATKPGPMVPQAQNKSTLQCPEIKQSEFECLNLNVWIPGDRNPAGGRLPVIAWVHGGGFMWGHNDMYGKLYIDSVMSMVCADESM